MIAYPDTSFLWAFYVHQSNSPAAAACASEMTEPLHLTELLRYEFRQSLRFQVWRNEANPREGIFSRDAQAALAQLETDLQNGIAVMVNCSTREVLERADDLSEQHTRTGGHRSFDILHVATALVLQAEEFLSFDSNQRQLANAVGLRVKP